MVNPREQWALSRLAMGYALCMLTSHKFVTFMRGHYIVRCCARCGTDAHA